MQKKKIKGNVFIDLIINEQIPKNSVLIKDALNEIIVRSFNNPIVFKKRLAQTLLTIELSSVGTQELQKDKQGYVDLYRTNVLIDVHYKNQDSQGTISVWGTHDFSVDDGSVVSDAKKFEAIKIASSKALEEMISKLALESFKRKDKKLSD